MISKRLVPRMLAGVLGENLTGTRLHPWLVYGGNSRQSRERGAALPWSNLQPLLKALNPDP